MLIENPDAFKAWLTSILEPLCDADPEALAKYVYALVKKEKPVDVLRDVMIEQLDVFLQKETVSFVELLFKTLEKQEYLLPPTVIPNANPPNPNVVPKLEPVEAPVQKDIKPIIPVSSLPNLTLDNINGISNVKKEKEPETQKKDKEREHKKSDSEKEEKTRVSRNRHRSTSRNRSRSRSWERSRRSRSRDRSRDRERRDRSRPWRNKSPPKRYDRRRSRSNSPPVPRNRSRSPRHNYRIRYRNRSPTRSVTRSRSRSYEKQLDKEKVKERKEVSRDPLSGAGTPTQDSNHGDTDMRLTSSTQSIQSVVAANPDGSLPTTTVAGVFQSKRRCRDFDEKGYCMRGELCPYDHGVDPVVLEDTALTSVLTFGPNGQPPIDGKDKHKFHSSKLPRHPPIGLLPPPLVRPNSGHMMQPHHMPPRPLHAPMPPEYNPSAPSMWNARPGFRGPMGPRGAGPAMFHGMHNSGPIMGVPQGAVVGSHNHVQRELISVPVIDNSGPVSDGVYPRTSDYMMIHDNNNLKKKQGFDFNRLGPRSKNPINCSLELKKVPRGLNNITHLNNHFTKFGKIVNIQVNFEGDPEAALITFSSHAEANAAYRSTEAVLNNRFIKVFWHNNGEGKQENLPSLQRSIKERLGQTGSPLVQANSNKVLNLVQPKATPPAESDSPKVENEPPSKLTKTRKEQSDEIKVQAIMKNQEILAAKEQLKRKQEEKRKEAVKLTHDLIKRKQELLDKQISQQKILIKKLEDGQVKGQQRDDLMKAINTLQQSIEEIRKSLIDTVKQTSNKPMAKLNQAAKITQIRKSKEETQKEILDTELDLITKQQEGVDTSELQLKLVELKKKAHVLGLPSRRGYASLRVPRGNKFLRAARHSFSHSNSTVDHRPTKVLISGYESDEKVEVIAHFSKYGNIVDYVTDDSTPSVVLNFKTRKEAEMALLKGKQFQDRTLSVTWCNNLQLSNQLSNTRHTTRTVLLESDEDHLLDCTIPEEEPNLEGLEGVDLSEEALLQDDEEEEEENEEDRSWRR